MIEKTAQLETLIALTEDMTAHLVHWNLKYGTVVLMKGLAVCISAMASDQKNPDNAIEEFVMMLRKIHKGEYKKQGAL